MRARAHAHTRCTHALARAPTLAHRHILSCVRTDSAHTRARAHTTCTRPLAYAQTPDSRAHALWRAHTLARHRRGAEHEQSPGCRVGTGESGLVLSEEGNPAGLSSCSGQLRSGLPFGPRSQASLQKAQGPGVCKLPKPPASRALCQAKRAPRA